MCKKSENICAERWGGKEDWTCWVDPKGATASNTRGMKLFGRIGGEFDGSSLLTLLGRPTATIVIPILSSPSRVTEISKSSSVLSKRQYGESPKGHRNEENFLLVPDAVRD
jgi:hypothetical protein